MNERGDLILWDKDDNNRNKGSSGKSERTGESEDGQDRKWKKMSPSPALPKDLPRSLYLSSSFSVDTHIRVGVQDRRATSLSSWDDVDILGLGLVGDLPQVKVGKSCFEIGPRCSMRTGFILRFQFVAVA